MLEPIHLFHSSKLINSICVSLPIDYLGEILSDGCLLMLVFLFQLRLWLMLLFGYG